MAAIYKHGAGRIVLAGTIDGTKLMLCKDGVLLVNRGQGWKVFCRPGKKHASWSYQHYIDKYFPEETNGQ